MLVCSMLVVLSARRSRCDSLPLRQPRLLCVFGWIVYRSLVCFDVGRASWRAHRSAITDTVRDSAGQGTSALGGLWGGGEVCIILCCVRLSGVSCIVAESRGEPAPCRVESCVLGLTIYVGVCARARVNQQRTHRAHANRVSAPRHAAAAAAAAFSSTRARDLAQTARKAKPHSKSVECLWCV